ncbi:MAG: patatin-like phospholipase family protein [Isosphaeraceae bacterium]
MAWHPEATRRRFGLTLSEEEKRAIREKLPHQDGVFYSDGVFEGGGVLGLAFLGAARCCSDSGIRGKGRAGTSAGSITAALLATDLTIERLEEILGGLDFESFLSEKTSILIRNGDPSDDLDSPAWMIANLQIARQLGQYSSEPFKRWIDAALREGGVVSFADVGRNDPDRLLKVVTSDISRGEMRVLPEGPEGQPRTFPVAEAVRLSMSIPFFFEPGKLGDSVIVDGGILSNFPLWIYDEPNPAVVPAWPTFGFRLVDRSEQQVRAIGSATDIVGAMVKTMMYASDRRYLSRQNLGRVIDLDITAARVKVTQFNLADDRKEELYRIGYQNAKDFFLNRWDWKEHLRLRGFPQPA